MTTLNQTTEIDGAHHDLREILPDFILTLKTSESCFKVHLFVFSVLFLSVSHALFVLHDITFGAFLVWL